MDAFPKSTFGVTDARCSDFFLRLYGDENFDAPWQSDMAWE
jgi:hypothetical protein